MNLRFVPVALFLLGFGVILAGCGYEFYFVNIPYQDPPPELEAQREEQSRVASSLKTGGIIFVGLGCAAAVILRWTEKQPGTRGDHP